MAKRTKKVGSVGRYQARYGVRSRSRVRNIELIQKKLHPCPSCGKVAVKRVSTSIWQCRKCNTKFAGGSYFPKTEVGQAVDKIMKTGLRKDAEEESFEELEEDAS